MPGLDPSPTADAAAIGAAEALSGVKRVESLTLGNGVVLRIKTVPPHAMRAAARSVAQPTPPRVWIATKGTDKNDPNDRGWEENPDDPDYRLALQAWMIDSDEAALRVGLLLGTDIISLPEGIHAPQSDEWIDEVEGVFAVATPDADMPKMRREPFNARYLDWLRYYAIPSDEDLFMLTRLVMATSVVTEEVLRDALAAFRGLQARSAYRALEDESLRRDGDQDSADGDDAARSSA